MRARIQTHRWMNAVIRCYVGLDKLMRHVATNYFDFVD